MTVSVPRLPPFRLPALTVAPGGRTASSRPPATLEGGVGRGGEGGPPRRVVSLFGPAVAGGLRPRRSVTVRRQPRDGVLP